MIRCALAEIFRLPTSTRRRRRPSISPSRIAGSRTTPLPITQTLSACRMPDGIRWNLNVSPSRTIVWPALLPPWKRTTRSACSASRSTTFPLPSSPHWAPTIARPGMAGSSVEGLGGPLRALRGHAEVVTHDRQRVVADLDQPRDGSRSDLATQPQDRVVVARDLQLSGARGKPLHALDEPLDLVEVPACDPAR